jgi:hypothetical protein
MRPLEIVLREVPLDGVRLLLHPTVLPREGLMGCLVGVSHGIIYYHSVNGYAYLLVGTSSVFRTTTDTFLHCLLIITETTIKIF